MNRKVSKCGSAVLEACICFPCFLIFVSIMISMIFVARIDLLMQRATNITSKKVEMILPTTTVAADFMSTVINALPNASINDELVNSLSIVNGALYAADEISTYSFRDILSDSLFSSVLERDVMAEYCKLKDKSYPIEPISIDIDIELEKFYIGLTVNYKVKTIVGEIDKSIYQTIPFYGDFELFLNGQNGESEDRDSSLWDCDNFERGDEIRELFECNLPQTFPIINTFEDGEAISYASMDLTAPTNQDLGVVESRIEDEIEALSGFEGATHTQSGNTFEVSDIISRTLVIIIPENSPDESKALVNSYEGYASSCGVSLKVEERGISNRYR